MIALECDRRPGQFSMRRRIWLFPPRGKGQIRENRYSQVRTLRLCNINWVSLLE